MQKSQTKNAFNIDAQHDRVAAMKVLLLYLDDIAGHI